MAKIKPLFVDAAGNVNDKKPHAKGKDGVIWIPDSALETIYINFLDNKTPFATQALQGSAGSIVGGVVVGPPDEYFYQLTVATLNGDKITARADPEIIVDPGTNVPPGGKKRGRKAAKKAGGRKKAAVKKKAGRKKATKKR